MGNHLIPLNLTQIDSCKTCLNQVALHEAHSLPIPESRNQSNSLDSSPFDKKLKQNATAFIKLNSVTWTNITLEFISQILFKRTGQMNISVIFPLFYVKRITRINIERQTQYMNYSLKSGIILLRYTHIVDNLLLFWKWLTN